MRLSEILSNPVRLRIVQYLQVNGEATTKQMCAELDDVPVPTVYRHINRLIEDEVLLVKEERKVRGSTERVLAINEKRWSEETGDLADVSYQFLMSLYDRFREYDGDPVKDMLCLRTCMLRLSDGAFESFLKEYAALLGKYLGLQDGGKVRNVSIISAPVSEKVEP